MFTAAGCDGAGTGESGDGGGDAVSATGLLSQTSEL